LAGRKPDQEVGRLGQDTSELGNAFQSAVFCRRIKGPWSQWNKKISIADGQVTILLENNKTMLPGRVHLWAIRKKYVSAPE
jgi:hypothetical protein